ncbi:MAG: ATP12 family protein [Pseudomonadota bacterium]
MKRFYERASVRAEADGFLVTLDERAVRTPRRHRLVVESEALAEAVAAEWQDQHEIVKPETMPINRLVTTKLDLMPERRQAAVEQLVDYGRSDLLCHRAEAPAELATEQAARWQPPLDWLAAAHGVRLVTTTGVMPLAQPDDTIERLGAVVEALDDWTLVGVHGLTTAAGSVVLGLMVAAAATSAAEATRTVLVDELHQRRHWGDDEEALEREARLTADVAAAARYLACLR